MFVHVVLHMAVSMVGFRYEQLSAEDVESVYQLVFCVSRIVSHAAGQFLAHQLLSEEQLDVSFILSFDKLDQMY